MEKSKTIFALLLFTTLSFGELMAQDKVPPKIYTPKQLEMIKSQRELVKKNREAFRNSLSESSRRGIYFRKFVFLGLRICGQLKKKQ